MNAGELFAGLSALAGAKDSSGASSPHPPHPRAGANGIADARLVNGVEYAATTSGDERRLRAAWRGRRGGGATPLVLVADHPDGDGILVALGPTATGPFGASGRRPSSTSSRPPSR